MTNANAAAARAWQVVRYGAPSQALELTEIPPLEPGPREVLVQVSTSVLNYNEVDGCRGRYLTINPPLPYTLGMEFVGEVIGAGEGAPRLDRAPRHGHRDGRLSVPTPSRSSAASTWPSMCPRNSVTSTRPASTSRSTWPTSACTSAVSSRRARPC